MGDVQSMFHQVRVPVEDRDLVISVVISLRVWKSTE